MRPETPGDEQDQRILFLVVGIVVLSLTIGIIALVFGSGSEEPDKPRFSKAELVDQTIAESENTHLEFELENPTEKSFEDIEIEISSESKMVDIWRGDNTAKEEGGRYVFSLKIPDILGGRESLRWKRAVNIEGTLYPGLYSMTVELEARVIADGEETDSETFRLKIESAD